MSREENDRMRCPQCGATYEPEVLFCTRDGTPLKLLPGVPRVQPGYQTGQSPQQPSTGKMTQDQWVKWVSIGIVAGLALIAIAFVGMLTVNSDGLELEVVFDGGYGLQIGDNVYVSDHVAGTVADIWLEGRDVVVKLQLTEDARPFLRSNSVFYVTSEHLLEQAKCICIFNKNNEPAVALIPGQRVYGIGQIPDILRHVWLEQAKGITWVLPHLIK